MIILGIETSCDDTGIAVIEAKPAKTGPIFNILSNIVSSQIKIHAPFGGVVPNLAAREHLKNIKPCLQQALREAGVTLKDTCPPMRRVDLIAVTIGPGLIPSLLIGVNFAKALAYKYKIPIVGVNHLEGHIAAALTSSGHGISNFQFPIFKTTFPAVALLVSGGHTQLILMQKFGHPAKKSSISNGASYKIIGETRDDAAGECFDKVAKLLGLGYPGGPIISQKAAEFNGKTSINLPRPMMNQNNFDFSFSGLKTAVLYLTRDNKNELKNPEFIQELCHETQQAIIDVLISKTFKAVNKHKAKTIILSGGVAANTELREQFLNKIQETRNKKQTINFLVPSKNLCTDNGAMIAMAGYYGAKRHPALRGNSLNSITANANLRIK